MKKKPIQWTQEAVAQAIELLTNGKTDRETANTLGRSREQICALRTRLKLPANKVEGRKPTAAEAAANTAAPNGTAVMYRGTCITASRMHLIDLMHEYGGGTLGRAKSVYRARCELQMAPGRDVPSTSSGSRVVFSFCSSAMGWL